MAYEVQEEDRKLFVGGLPQDVDQNELKEYFGKYGELDRVQLKMDPQTGRSRGFGFILYKDVSGLDACAAETHIMRGKTLTAKKADIKPGKIYLGKLPQDGISEDDIREYFSQYGTITEYVRPIDKMKNNEPKNFCFITFERERVSKKMIEQGQCNINGHRLMIKQVNPNPRDPNAMGGGRGGGFGGMGRGRGGAGGYGASAGGWGGGMDSGYGAAATGGYGGGWGSGADASGGYGAAAAGGWGADASGGYGAAATGYGGGYGDASGGYGGGYGGGAMGGGYGGGAGGGKMMRGGGGRGGRGGGGRGGRGRPY